MFFARLHRKIPASNEEILSKAIAARGLEVLSLSSLRIPTTFPTKCRDSGGAGPGPGHFVRIESFQVSSSGSGPTRRPGRRWRPRKPDAGNQSMGPRRGTKNRPLRRRFTWAYRPAGDFRLTPEFLCLFVATGLGPASWKYRLGLPRAFAPLRETCLRPFQAILAPASLKAQRREVSGLANPRVLSRGSPPRDYSVTPVHPVSSPRSLDRMSWISRRR